MNLSQCVKSYGHLCQIYQNHSPNMVMSRDWLQTPKLFIFRLILYFFLNFRKSYQIWGELAQEQTSYWQKTNWGWKTPPSPSAYGVNLLTTMMQQVFMIRIFFRPTNFISFTKICFHMAKLLQTFVLTDIALMLY